MNCQLKKNGNMTMGKIPVKFHKFVKFHTLQIMLNCFFLSKSLKMKHLIHRIDFCEYHKERSKVGNRKVTEMTRLIHSKV